MYRTSSAAVSWMLQGGVRIAGDEERAGVGSEVVGIDSQYGVFNHYMGSVRRGVDKAKFLIDLIILTTAERRGRGDIDGVGAGDDLVGDGVIMLAPKRDEESVPYVSRNIVSVKLSPAIDNYCDGSSYSKVELITVAYI